MVVNASGFDKVFGTSRGGSALACSEQLVDECIKSWKTSMDYLERTLDEIIPSPEQEAILFRQTLDDTLALNAALMQSRHLTYPRMGFRERDVVIAVSEGWQSSLSHEYTLAAFGVNLGVLTAEFATSKQEKPEQWLITPHSWLLQKDITEHAMWVLPSQNTLQAFKSTRFIMRNAICSAIRPSQSKRDRA